MADFDPELSISDTHLDISNAALTMLGSKSIPNFDGNDLRTRTIVSCYADVVEEVLSMMPWRAGREQFEMTASVDDAPPPWESLWEIPANILTIQSVWEDNQKVQFERYQNRIATITGASYTGKVYVEGIEIPDIAGWPAYIRRPLIMYLASQICVPITQDEKRANELEIGAMRRLRVAASRDSQGRTPSRVDTRMFIRARRGSRRGGSARFTSS